MAITSDENIVLATKQRFADIFFGFNNVHGVGVAQKRRRGTPTGFPAILVVVERKLPPRLIPNGQRIPSTLPAYDLGGTPLSGLEVAVDVDEGGPYALAAKNTKRVRPLRPGFSFGKNGAVGSGTIGAKLIDLTQLPAVQQRDPKGVDRNGFLDLREFNLPPDFPEFFLTCAHVFATQPNDGDDVVQPSADDGGRLRAIGTPVRWTPVPQTRVNVAAGGVNTSVFLSHEDVAAVRVKNTKIGADIIGIGAPTGQLNISYTDIGAGRPKLTVQKSGRTTGRTEATVTAVSYDAVANLPGSPLQTKLRDQIRAIGKGTVAAGGDSGALVLDKAKKAAGLLVAAGGTEMIFTPMMRVLLALNYPPSKLTVSAKNEPTKPQHYFVLTNV